MRSLVRRPEDKGSVLLAFLGPLPLVGLVVVDFNHPALDAAWWFAAWAMVCRHNYILHNHVHHPMTTSGAVNKAMEVMLAVVTAMPAGNWKLMHVHGHHVEHRIEWLASRAHIRPFRVPRGEGNRWTAGPVFSLVRIPRQFLTPIVLLAIGLTSPWRAKRIWSRYYLFDYLALAAFVLGLAMIDWQRTLFGVIGIYGLVYWVSIYVDYATHVQERADGQHRLSFSNVCHTPAYNRLFWNFGHHAGHHMDPRTHWTALPALERELGITASDETAVSTLNIYGLFRPAFTRWQVPRRNAAP